MGYPKTLTTTLNITTAVLPTPETKFWSNIGRYHTKSLYPLWRLTHARYDTAGGLIQSLEHEDYTIQTLWDEQPLDYVTSCWTNSTVSIPARA